MALRVSSLTAHPRRAHSSSLRIPFKSHTLATVAKRALDVDREQNSQFVERKLTVEDSYLNM